MAGPAAKLKTRSDEVVGGVWRGVVVVEAGLELLEVAGKWVLS